MQQSMAFLERMIMKLFTILLAVALIFTGSFMFPCVSSVEESSVIYDVQQYGAKGDGITDNSKVR